MKLVIVSVLKPSSQYMFTEGISRYMDLVHALSYNNTVTMQAENFKE